MHNLKFKRDYLLENPDIYWSHEYSRRNSNLFRLPHTTTEVGRNCFVNNGVLFWEKLSNITTTDGTDKRLTDIVSSVTFKQKLKEFLLNEFTT